MSKKPINRPYWPRKFYSAGQGTWTSLTTQRSFIVHVPMTIAVVGVAIFLDVDRLTWAILLLCIGGVWTAELLNTAIEHLGKAITEEHHPEIGRALDAASGAVLVFSITAATIGVILLLVPLLQLWARAASQ